MSSLANLALLAGLQEEKKKQPEAAEVPHYQLPNFSSILPEYSNTEQDYIKDAFSASNFVSITRIPNEIKPSGISKKRTSQMHENRKATLPVSGKRTTKNGLFQEFEYIPSRYSLAEELKTKARLEKEAKRLEVAGKDFVPSSNNRRLKFEDAFEDKEHRYPYMSDPYDSAMDLELRQNWLENTKILHGPFVPSGSAAPSRAQPTRAVLPDIIKELHRIIKDDWDDHNFDVLATEDDNIAIRFDLLTIESEKGLLAYINVLATSNAVVDTYGLKKVVEDWNTKPGDGFLYFMFRPPWVATRALDSFYTLHPEERHFATSRAGVQHAKTQAEKNAPMK